MRGQRLADMHEPLLIAHVIDTWPRLYELLDFVVTPAIGDFRTRGEWDFFFAANIPREMLGLKTGRQPGDVDILVVPLKDGRPVGEAAGAVEVKRLALKGPNWTKNVDRYGLRQAEGLLADGFAFAGLLHLIVATEGPPEFHREMGVARITDPVRSTFELVGDEVTDVTGFMAAERQYRRLFARDPHPLLGINCVAVDEIVIDGATAASTSVTPGRLAQPNPKASRQLAKNIELFVEVAQERARLRSADRRRLAEEGK